MKPITVTMDAMHAKKFDGTLDETRDIFEQTWSPGFLCYGTQEGEELTTLLVVGTSEQIMPILAEVAARSGYGTAEKDEDGGS